MQATEAAILRTIIYADLFSYPLTLEEIQHYLISDQPTTLHEIQHILMTSTRLANTLICTDGYYVLQEHSGFVAERKRREQISQHLWQDAIRYGRLLARIPFVRMVAITGALAMRNAPHAQDDYDYLLVTRRGRVWLTRAMAVVLVRLVRLLGRELCPNYVVAEDQLQQEQQDVYIAHEVIQLHPVYGGSVYHTLLQRNCWTRDYLPNACAITFVEEHKFLVKPLLERMLDGWLGNRLEQWEFRRKQRKFTPKTQQPQSAARIDEGQAKGHFDDHGHPVLQRYYARLREYGIQDIWQERRANENG